MEATTMPNDRLFLRTPQLTDLEETIRSNESKLNNPHIQDKPFVRRQLARLRKQRDDQRAPELDAAGRDAVSKRAKELADKIREGMPSHEEMRKNPNGAIGMHQRWEKAHKKRVIEWKNAQVALNPGNDDPDLSNVESLRPTVSHLGMHSAQIVTKTFSLPSEQYKENFDEAFAKKPSSTKGKKSTKMSAEARQAASDKARARWAERKAAKAAQQAAAEPQGEQSVAS